MGKYLFQASYTAEGLQGVRSAGAASRVKSITGLVASLGGKVESFNFAFGDTDAYVVCELPNDETAAAIALAVSGSGVVSLRTVKLLTAEQVDAAFAINVPYTAPGS